MEKSQGRERDKLKVHNHIIFKTLIGKSSKRRSKQIEKDMKQSDDCKWFELGIEDWSDILYFDLNATNNDAETDEDED